MSSNQFSNSAFQQDSRGSAESSSPSAGESSQNAPDQQDTEVRYDPRDGSVLVKRHIANPNGPDVSIDVNPATGGVFLDKGKLDLLSDIPDVFARLDQALSME